MKTIKTIQIHQFLLVTCFALLTFNGYSQNPVHWTMSMEACTATDTNKIEFSLYCEFDGTIKSPIPSTMELTAYSFGINYNPAIVTNNGVLSISQVAARDPQLSNLNNASLSASPVGHIRLTISPKPIGSGFIVTTTTKYFLGRFRLTSTRTFATNLAVAFSPQCAQVGGLTNYAVSYYLNGNTVKTATSFSTTPPQPAMTCNVATSCSAFIVNPSCPIASVGAATYTGCGTVNISGIVANLFDSVRWSTSGNGTFGFPTATGTNTYTPGIGETSATLTLRVYKANCINSTANTIYTNRPSLGIKSIISTCNSYTWGVNGQTYTTTGIYINATTNTSNCIKIDSLFLTVNPNVFPVITGNNNFCAGDSTLLDAGLFAIYIWSTGATTRKVFVKTAGTFTVTVFAASGCAGSASKTILVNPLPSVSFTGLAVNYPANAAPAILTGLPVSGLFTGNGISGNTFSPSSAGIGGPYNITYTFRDENNCSNSASHQTSVTAPCIKPAIPAAIKITGGPANVCPGESRTYTVNSVPGATSYLWTPPLGATITSGQGTVSVLVNYNAGFTASDTIRVKARNACGTSFDKKLRVARINPSTPGPITGQAFGLCNQNAIPYSVSNVSGITYNWSFSVAGASIATGQGSNGATANFGTTFLAGTIRVSATNGCGTSAPRSLIVRAMPATPVSITGVAAVCVNQFGVPYSTVAVASAINYTWTCPNNARINDGVVTSLGTTLTTTATAVTVNFAAIAGNVRVRGNNACGSGSYLSKTVNFVCRDETDASNLFSVACYPQPASGLLNVTFSSSEESSFKFILSDITGKKVQQQVVKTTEGQNLLQLDVSNLAPGLYMLEVNNGANRSNQKIMIE